MSRVSVIAFALAATSTAIAAAAPVNEGGRKFTVVLTGAAEVAGGTTPADMDGSGTARIYVNHGQRRVCWEFVDLAMLDPLVGAHIHEAPANDTGDVVVPLGTATSGCTNNVDRALLIDIIQNPQKYYVNVHTSVFPSGAIRGQMSK